jgi:hypothetical protein
MATSMQLLGLYIYGKGTPGCAILHACSLIRVLEPSDGSRIERGGRHPVMTGEADVAGL